MARPSRALTACTILLATGALLLAAGARAERPVPAVPPLESPVVSPEPKTIESHVLIAAYDLLKPEAASAWRVEFPGADGDTRVGHWQLPSGPAPHPTVVVFPIRAGDHVVSEALAKALVNRGYAAIWLERRRPLFGEDDHREPGDFEAFAADLGNFVIDARRLIGWLATRPEVDRERIAVAGVSLGGILAANTLAQEPLVRAGFFVMAGGGLPEILRDSQDPDLVQFRERAFAAQLFTDGEDLARQARRYTDPIDPLSWADRIAPEQVLLISARFDQVIAPERTEALWRALGRPRWLTVPTGHYQLVPYFWWSVGRGADHLDRVFSRPACGAQAQRR
jgi:dienelactone hydrolase